MSHFDKCQLEMKEKLETKPQLLWVTNGILRGTMEISLVSRKRGESQNRKLGEAHENPSMITRRSLAVLCASITSTDGVLSAPLQVGAKLLVSRAAQLLPGGPEVWRKPLVGIDDEFVGDCLKYIDSISDYEKIKPLKRQLIEIGEKLKEVLIFHDGSSSSAGGSIYLVTQNTESKQRTAARVVFGK